MFLKSKRARLTAVGLGVIVALYGAYNWSQSPVSANLSHKSVSTPSKAASAVSASQPDARTPADPWLTDYFSTVVPAGYAIHSSDEDGLKPVMGSYSLLSTGSRQSDQISVTIAKLTGSTDEISAIRLRQTQPDKYVSETRSYAPAGAIVFSRKDTYETAIFWQNNGRYAAVVASGVPHHRQQLEQALETVTGQWQWR